MLSPSHEVVAPRRGDFLVDDGIVLEVGGRNKSAAQVAGLPEAYLALDGLETGIRRKVPLWLFGFLY